MLSISLSLVSLISVLLVPSAHASVAQNVSLEDPRRLAADGLCLINTGIDYVGTDIANAPAVTATDCCPLCGEMKDCQGFAWTNWNGGTCWFKTAITGTVQATSDVRSSQIRPSYSPGGFCAVENFVEYTGTTIGTADGGFSGNACCTKCRDRAGCVAFTYNSNDNTCYLKSERGDAKPTTDYLVSGIVQQPLCDKPEANVDYSGNDVGNAPSTIASECCTKCASVDGCGAYTWTNANGGTCWFKSRKGAQKPSQGAISAVMNFPLSSTPSKCPIVEAGVDYRGNDIASVPGAASDCCTKCGRQSGCGAFTWNQFNGGTCWLKSSKGETVATSMAGVVSAVYRR